MTTKQRSETIGNGDTVVLKVQFKDNDGYNADLDTYPNISIVQPSGNVMLGPTSAGVYRISTGLYAYNFAVGLTENIGVYFDVWNGYLSGSPVSGSFNFIVVNTQLPAINSDGYLHLGDEVGFDFSQTAILNINKFIKGLKARLSSSGKARIKDQYGNIVYQDCDIYSVEQLAVFAVTALSAFNEIPHFTAYTFEDSEIITIFYEVILQHAVVYALASKALIERGREFSINDNGVSFTPPGISEVLGSQFSTELNNWFEKVKLVKSNMKPRVLGLGTMTSIGSSNAISKFRHRREGRII